MRLSDSFQIVNTKIYYISKAICLIKKLIDNMVNRFLRFLDNSLLKAFVIIKQILILLKKVIKKIKLINYIAVEKIY